MSRKAKHNKPTTPANVFALEDTLRRKRLDVVDRLAQEAWEAGDEDAMIRFRYEWQSIREVLDLPLEELRERVQQGYGDDKEWEKINLWRASYDAHEYVREYYKRMERRKGNDPSCA